MHCYLSNEEVRALAALLAPYLSPVAQRDGFLSDAAIRLALGHARRDGIKVPRIRSDRTIRRIEQAYTEGV